MVSDAWVRVMVDLRVAVDIAHSGTPRCPINRLSPLFAAGRSALQRVCVCGEGQAETLAGVNTTPVWVPLVVAALGFVSTLGGALVGVIITQRRADKREQEARDAEFERERARWAREDAARTFDERRVAYIAFYEALRQVVTLVNSFFDEGADLSKLPLPCGWEGLLYRQLQHVEIYGSEAVVALAQRAFEITTVWGGTLRRSADDPTRVTHDEDLSYEADGSPFTFISAVRKELGVPEGEPPKTGPMTTT